MDCPSPALPVLAQDSRTAFCGETDAIDEAVDRVTLPSDGIGNEGDRWLGLFMLCLCC